MPYTHDSTTVSANPINSMAQDAVCHSKSVKRYTPPLLKTKFKSIEVLLGKVERSFAQTKL